MPRRLNTRSILRGLSWIPSLYLAEGIPYIIVMSIAVLMYKRMGLSNAELTFYTSWLSLPWVIKPLWSPIVDIFGTRRAWILAMQAAMAAGFASIALFLPGHAWFQASMASFLIIAFLSATHDIAADGFYIIALDSENQSFFVGIRTLFYRLAMILAQGPLVMMAGWLENTYGDIPQAWATVFYILAATFALLATLHLFLLPRPASDIDRRGKSTSHIFSEFITTFREFFSKPGITTAILFILLYKFPEAQLIKIIQPFMVDSTEAGGLGMSTTDVGMAYGIVGVIGLISGGIIGGIVVARGTLRRWLMPMAWSMSATCGTFLLLCHIPSPSPLLVNTAVAVEQFGYGFGTTAYILYLIKFSEGPRATSNYAICTGLMSLGMMLPGMIAGQIQQWLGYHNFFLWTLACCVTTLAVSHHARKTLP